MIQNFILGLFVGLGSSIPLGPLGVMCVQKTLSKGRNSGFLTGTGAALTDTIFAAFAILSLAVIQEFVAEYETYVLFFGGIVVALIGLKIYYTNPVKELRRRDGGKKHFEDFISGFLMTITNPGAIFLILGLFAFVGININADSTKGEITATLWGVFVGSSLWWFILSTGINIFRAKFRLRQLVMINKVAGITIIALSLITFFEGVWRIIKATFFNC